MAQDVSQLEDELRSATQDLKETLTSVDRKIEAIESELQPERFIDRHPIAAVAAAAAAGFALGAPTESLAVAAAVALAALVTHAAQTHRRERAR